MKKQIIYYVLAFIAILFSSPFGYKTLTLIYRNRKLAGEFTLLLNGFIHSFMLIGLLLFILGLLESYKK